MECDKEFGTNKNSLFTDYLMKVHFTQKTRNPIEQGILKTYGQKRFQNNNCKIGESIRLNRININKKITIKQSKMTNKVFLSS